jgi:ketosteroid isomerase-like protein
MPNPQAIVQDWFNAIENKNADRMLDLLADDIVIETELGTSLSGKEPIRQLTRLIGAYESIRIEAKTGVANGRDVAVLAHVHARFRDNVEAFGVQLPVAGKAVDLDVALFCEVNDAGKLTHVTRIQNLLALMHQLDISVEQLQQFTGQLLEAGRSA